MTSTPARDALDPPEFVLANARLVLADEVVLGSVLVRDGRIAAIDQSRAVPANALNCLGDFVSAGLVELHTDNIERHLKPRPGVDWPTRLALLAHDSELAAVGITTVFDALRVGSVTRGRGYRGHARATFAELGALRARGAFRIDHRLHLRAEICSETLPQELAAFGPEDAVGLVSLMDHTPGQRQFRNQDQFRIYLKGKHAMSDADIDTHFSTLMEIRAEHGAPNEAAAVAEARRLGAALASHDDTTEADVAASAAYGARVAEFPTTLDAARASARRGLAIVMGAPNLIRGGSHSGNVPAAELAEAGLLDILSSDYAPSSLLGAAIRAGLERGDLAAGLRLATAAPARAVGLQDRGRLAPGLRADLLRFALIDDAPAIRGVWSAGRRVA